MTVTELKKLLSKLETKGYGDATVAVPAGLSFIGTPPNLPVSRAVLHHLGVTVLDETTDLANFGWELLLETR